MRGSFVVSACLFYWPIGFYVWLQTLPIRLVLHGWFGTNIDKAIVRRNTYVPWRRFAFDPEGLMNSFCRHCAGDIGLPGWQLYFTKR